MIFLAQIIGCLAISLWVISLQSKDRKNLLKLQSIANLLYGVEYILLSAYSAAFMNIISTIRCIIYSKKDEKETHLLNIIFVVIIIFLGIITYSNILSLIPIIITCLYTLSSSKNNIKWNKIIVLITAFIWIYYNYKVGAYITIIGNIFEIISSTLSLYKIKVKK